MSNEYYSDKELCDQIKKKDSKAINILYQKYSRQIESITFYRLKDYGRIDLVNDVNNDIWCEIFNSISNGNFRADGELGKYILGIFYKAFSRSLKKYNDYNTINIKDEKGFEIFNLVENEDKNDIDLSNIVKSEILRLPVQFKNVMQLRYFEYMSYSQIANILGIPTGTVSTRIKVSLEKISRRVSYYFRKEKIRNKNEK